MTALLDHRGQPLEARSRVDLANPKDPVLAEWFGGGPTLAGVQVTERSAMAVTAVFRAVSVIAETLAAMPLQLMERTEEHHQPARAHPLYPLLDDQPNELMTAFEFKEWLAASVALRGAAFAEIRATGAGRIESLEPLSFDAVAPRRLPTGRMGFGVYDQAGGRRILGHDDMAWIPYKVAPTGESISPIRLHAPTIGLAIAQRNHQAALHGNSAAPKGALKLPGAINDEAAFAIRDAWERRHRGPQNVGKLAILDGGLEYQAIGLANDDMQALELLQFSTRDIARIFGVPPHKIGDLSDATYSNIEEQGIDFVRMTVLPWASRIEQRLDKSTLSRSERTRLFHQFKLSSLLRGDARARAEYYRNMFYTSSMSPNEIRRMEDMPPIEGGDQYFVQGATVPVDLLSQSLPQGGAQI